MLFFRYPLTTRFLGCKIQVSCRNYLTQDITLHTVKRVSHDIWWWRNKKLNHCGVKTWSWYILASALVHFFPSLPSHWRLVCGRSVVPCAPVDGMIWLLLVRVPEIVLMSVQCFYCYKIQQQDWLVKKWHTMFALSSLETHSGPPSPSFSQCSACCILLMFMLLMSLTKGAVRKPKSLNMLKESGLSATRVWFLY